MAINPNNELKADHWFFAGGTGSGKTQAMKRELKAWVFPQNVIWDPEQDHHAHHLHSMSAFKREFMRAIASRKRFRLALTVEPTEEAFLEWCDLVWKAADGNVPMGVYMEELADVTSAGKAIGAHGAILRKGRKYNIHSRGVSQRPQECPKTLISMCGYKWCGHLENIADTKVMAGHLGLRPEDLQAMPANIDKKKLHFYLKIPGEQVATLGDFDPSK